MRKDRFVGGFQIPKGQEDHAMRQKSLCYRLLPRCRGRFIVAALIAFASGLLLVASAPDAIATGATVPMPVRPTLTSVRVARHLPAQSIWMEVTAYCPCKVCCGLRANGITASGKSVRHNGGRFVAADTDVLPFGTRVSIPGYHDGKAVPVIDTGSAINGHRLDVFFSSHAKAEAWGRKMLRVRVDRAG